MRARKIRLTLRRLRQLNREERFEHSLTEWELKHKRLLSPDEKPRTRAECAEIPRPCVFVSCKYNLFLDVMRNKKGQVTSVVENKGVNCPSQVPPGESCALDVAERGPKSMDDVGALLRLRRQRIEQLEKELLIKLREAAIKRGLTEEDLNDDARLLQIQFHPFSE